MNVQAQPITSTPVETLGSQSQTKAPAQARPQAPAQSQPQAPAKAQPPRLAQAQLPQPHAAVPLLLVRQSPSDSLHDEDRVSMDFSRERSLLNNETGLFRVA